MNFLEIFCETFAQKGNEVSIGGNIFDISNLKNKKYIFNITKPMIKIGKEFNTEFYLITTDELERLLNFLKNKENYKEYEAIPCGSL